MQKLNPEFQLGHQVIGWNHGSVKIAGTYIIRDLSPTHDINPIRHKILTYSGRIETVRHVKFHPNADTFLTGDIVQVSDHSDFAYSCQGEFLFLDLEDPNSPYTIRTGNGPVSFAYCRYPREEQKSQSTKDPLSTLEEKLEKLREEFLAHKATAKANTIRTEDKYLSLKNAFTQQFDEINNQLRSHSSHLKGHYHRLKNYAHNFNEAEKEAQRARIELNDVQHQFKKLWTEIRELQEKVHNLERNK